VRTVCTISIDEQRKPIRAVEQSHVTYGLVLNIWVLT
jgi:hypothetical protein